MNTRNDGTSEYQTSCGGFRDTSDDCKPSSLKRAKQKKKNEKEGGVPYLKKFMDFYGR